MATSTMTRPRTGATGNPQRRRQGRPPRPRRRWLRLVLLVLILALLGTGLWLVGFSSVLATRQVTVSDTAVLSRAEVRAAAAVPMGLPLARQDLGAVAQRIATLAPVESVQVERRWPNTVAIDVTERTPALAVKQGTEFTLVDRHGIAYDTVARPPEDVLTATVDVTNGPVLVDAATVAAGLPNDLRSTIDAIRATSVNTITLTIDKGPTIIWGTSDQTPLKAQVVRALLDQKGSLRQIDVSAPHNPAVR